MISAQDIDTLLPQTQCQECGYQGCLPYAEALAQGLAPIDRCPPGGISTLKALARLLKIDPTPYLEKTQELTRPPSMAVIRESECIGCTKCIQACPVDAIVGSAKLMHGILADECTGCGLCVEPCPVDCIDMVPLEKPRYDKTQARTRFNQKQIRLLKEQDEKQRAYREKRNLAFASKNQTHDKTAKQAYILEALARSKSRTGRNE